VHVCLHGDTSALGLIASFILSHNWSVHLGSPAVTWKTDPEGEAWRRWAERNYSFLQHAEAAFGEGDAPRIGAVDRIEGSLPEVFTAHIVDFGDDDRTLVATLDLASRLTQKHDKPTLVKAVLRDSEAIGELLRRQPGQTFSEPVFLGAGLPFQALGDYLRKAAETHGHHLLSLARAAEPVSAREWGALGETYVHATHAASDHGPIKMFDVDRARTLDPAGPPPAERLAMAEHSRWTAERLLDGWAPAAQRNNDRRLHDKLVPWAALPQADRDREIDFIRLELDDRVGLDPGSDHRPLQTAGRSRAARR
jgi:hypothetical protein